MTTLEPSSREPSTAAAAYPDAGETRRLRAGRLRFFRTIAESVGVQGPTAGVVIAPAVLASVSAWTLMLVYVSFAGGLCAVTAAEAGPALGTVGLHLSWQVYAIITFVLVMALAYLDIKISATVILALEGISMLLVVIACSIILAKGGFHGHAFSSAPFRPDGVAVSVLGLGIVLSFSSFTGFEAAATLGE